MNIGVIGSGNIGGTLTRRLQTLGHHVTVANSRGPQSLLDLAEETGAEAGTVEAAAESADVVVIAVPLAAVPELPAEVFRGRVVVDANNYYPERDGDIAEIADKSVASSRWTAEHLPGARVVKAFNTINWQRLGSEGATEAPREERLAIPVAGDDAEAKRLVAELIEQIGFAALDTGSLADGGRLQQPGAPFFNRPLRLLEAERELAELRG